MQHIVKNNLYPLTIEVIKCDGSPLDLSHSTIKFILKKNKTDDDEQALLSVEYVNSDTNIVQFEFTADQTKNLPNGLCIGAIKIFRADNKNEEIWSDEYTITDGVFNG